MTWLTMSIFTLDEESEKHILFSHLKKKERYLLGKWLTLMIVMIPLLLFAVFFPILTDSFKGNMSAKLYMFTFYSHFVFVVFGILVGTLFSATQFATKKYAWLSAVLTVVISLSSKSILEISALFKWVLWIFPPTFKVVGHLESTEQGQIIHDGIFVIIYLFVGVLFVVLLFKKKER